MNNEMDKNNVYLSGAEAAASRAVELARMELAEENRKKKAKLIKLAAMCVFLGIAVVFMTISWFTMSRETETKGMTLAAEQMNFKIYTNSGGRSGTFYDKHQLVSEIDENATVVWKMLPGSNNFGNYDTNAEGIGPDSSGYITFYVMPTTDEIVNISFNFELIGYNEKLVSGQTKMEPLDDSSAAKQFLNGHILLFENYENGVYSGLIETGEDLKRVLRNKTFSGKDTENPVNIYWIWPKNLSNLVYINDISTAGSMLCGSSGAGYDTLTSYICSHPGYFMKNETSALTLPVIASNYSDYGGEYDQADNDIGTGVRYLFLRMTVT